MGGFINGFCWAWLHQTAMVCLGWGCGADVNTPSPHLLNWQILLRCAPVGAGNRFYGRNYTRTWHFFLLQRNWFEIPPFQTHALSLPFPLYGLPRELFGTVIYQRRTNWWLDFYFILLTLALCFSTESCIIETDIFSPPVRFIALALAFSISIGIGKTSSRLW